MLWPLLSSATLAFRPPVSVAYAACRHRNLLASPLCSDSSRPFNEGNPPPAGDPAVIALKEKAKLFVAMKNVGDLDAVFSMSAPDADMYGLVGADTYKPGLTKFFEEHPELLHVILGEPHVVGPATVQYAFEKSWRDADGELRTWLSRDPVPEDRDGRPAKPRDKVERLEFDDAGRLVKVSVVQRAV